MASEKKREFSADAENAMIAQVVDAEYTTGKMNIADLTNDYESYLDMIDAERTEKEYDWMSDVTLGEFSSQVRTQSAIDVAQTFSTRDFSEVYLEESTDKAILNAAAIKELINRTLNQRHLHHYQKFVRGKIINQLIGHVYGRCWWEQKFERRVVGQRPILADQTGIDPLGNPVTQQVETGEFEDVFGDVAVVDRFNHDVLDPRNVFVSEEYVYSVQDKRWIILRFEKTLEELKEEAEIMGYFNLDRLEQETDNSETETSMESYNKTPNMKKENKGGSKTFDILERYGKVWAIVVEKDPDTDAPTEIKPGIGHDGKPLDKAEFIEAVCSFAIGDSEKELIRFQVQPYEDSQGNKFRPIYRALCYIHPSDDAGAGDGKHSRELQVAIDDTFCLGLDRTRLATLPVLKGRASALSDNSTIRFEPMHVMELDDPNDVQEMVIRDDITGVLQQIAMLTDRMETSNALPKSAQGQLPAKSSQKATAIAVAENRTSTRTNYKSKTYEHTGQTELYWMIIQMTARFAQPETGIKLMGEKVFNFDPSKDYYYKAVTSAIESEQNKSTKLNQWMQALQVVAQTQHKNSAALFDTIMGKIFELMGDEFANVAGKYLDGNTPIQAGGQQAAQANTGGGPSNQNGVQQSGQEVATRQAANVVR